MMMRSLPWLLAPALLLVAGGPAVRTTPTATLADLSLTHSGGVATLTIAVDGPVSLQEATLKNPDRIQLDFTGTTLGAVPAYDGVRRGHVTGVRAYQYQPSVVRLVVELDAMQTYSLSATDPGQVRITFGSSQFANWNAPAARPAAAIQPLRAGGFVDTRQQQDKFSFTWVNNTYEDVVTSLSAAGNRSIILGGTVKSVPVTMSLREKTWAQAFNAFLEAHKLAAKELDGGIILVDDPLETSKLDSLERLVTRQLKLNYAQATSMVAAMEKMVSKPRGAVSADSATNSLLVTDTPTRIAEMEALLTQLDVKNRTIQIETKIVFVDRTDLEQLGVKYDLGDQSQFFNKLIQRTDPVTGSSYNPNVNVVNLYGSSVSAISNADQSISGSALDLIFSTAIGGYSVTSFLSALQRIEMTDVEATTTIGTLDNQEALITAGEETPVRVIDLSSAGAGAAPRATVTFKETGIKLIAKPHVTNNGQIRMSLTAERSSVQPLAAADLGYTIPKQYAQTVLMLNNGQTGMVGGLVVSTITKNRSGIPLLSSLPFIGSLFSFTENRENRRDLIITVTPRIVD